MIKFQQIFVFCCLSGIGWGQSGEINYNPNQKSDTTRKSIPARAILRLEQDSITIDYHSPGVRRRIIWGGLVPFGEVWVTGAHNATKLSIPFDFVMGGKRLPAGEYAIFSIPGKKEWTVILNKHWEQHLTSEYDPKDDLIRIRVKPRKTEHTERLQYFMETHQDGKIDIAIVWEKIRIPFNLTIQR
ncbi:MAG TPA: DUF2911 domain-containing protein [Saprospiraceae bacterium]|nr:DUF2911 domain-containing protein [Saprospiraceae bacterium]HNT20639.1 DUF2911 domain-containing protein [Saprospiraceae bacterium]